jgi:DNA-cytosine methyltransferase
MNVLSLFDGMSCGHIALDKAGVQVDNYFASEVDKYAIQVAQTNYPDTVHLGDVRDVRTSEGMLYVTEGDGCPHYEIDLLMGGSPCQGFSFAGSQLNFDDPRSKLFWEFVRLKNELQPQYFLLENVRMAQRSQDVITEALGVEPIAINSNLVSAQNRYRLYWTNIPFDMPTDRGITMNDILEGDWYSDRDKSHCLDANYFKGGNLRSYFTKHRRQLVFSKDGMACVGEADVKGHGYNKRVYHKDGKAPSLCAASGGNLEPKVFIEPDQWRKLTPTECERLQTVPDGYTSSVSNTQRYKMLGNGWTVDVVANILKGAKR